MTKADMLEVIDKHKNKMIDPVEMLKLVWIRVFINCIPEEDYDRIMGEAIKILSK